MKNSIIVAGVLAVGATAWILSGQIASDDRQAVANERAETKERATNLISVRIRPVQPRTQQWAVIVNGRTEESREVTIRAETAGPIVAISREVGSIVDPGDVIARQDVEDRTPSWHKHSRLFVSGKSSIVRRETGQKGFRSDQTGRSAHPLGCGSSSGQVEADRPFPHQSRPFRGILERGMSKRATSSKSATTLRRSWTSTRYSLSVRIRARYRFAESRR